MKIALTALAAAALCAVIDAQPLDRLSGKVIVADPAAAQRADVRVEAIFGFAGGDFLGQKVFTTRANAKGDWALLAFKAGVSMFDASAPGHLPDVIALPFNLVSPPASGTGGLVPTWHPILKPTPIPPADAGRLLTDALAAVRADRPDRATPLLARLADSGDANVLVAAGRICLLMKDATAARTLTTDKDERGYLAAAINDVNKAHNVMRGTD